MATHVIGDGSPYISAYSPGEALSLVMPRLITQRAPLSYLHHAGEDGSTWARRLPDHYLYPFTNASMKHGFSSVGVYQTLGFGNDESRNRAAQGIQYLRDNNLASNDDGVILAASMGTQAALIYAMDNPNDVSCLVLMMPVVDLPYYYANDTNGFRTMIGDAWGVTYPTPLPSEADIPARINEVQCPVYVIRGATDNWYVGDSAAAINAIKTTEIVVPGIGHNWPAIMESGMVDVDDVFDFINSYTR